MKTIGHILKSYIPWLLLLTGVNAFCAIILWIADIQAFRILIGLILLTSIILYAAIIAFLYTKASKRQSLFEHFLTQPDTANEEKLLAVVNHQDITAVRLLASVLRQHETDMAQLYDSLSDYEEYVESWAHEAKTPLSLLTLLLDNHSDEIPASIETKLEYIRSQLQEDVDQMLYYARLKTSTKDYRFETITLGNCLQEVLDDYRPLLEEKEFIILNHLHDETVYTDRRGLQFMLSQIISNAIKYSSFEPMLTFALKHSEQSDALIIEDNGTGVKSHNLPYIFQKGFTGDSTDSRKKATGMGLYLTKRMADDLNLQIEAESEWGKGFRINITFPILE